MPCLVRVHRDLPLTFPPTCVACGAAQPESSVRLLAWGSAENALSRHRFDAPACTACARHVFSIRRRRWVWTGGGIAIAAMLLIGMAIGGRRLPNWTTWLAAGASVLVVCGPAWYLHQRSPLPVRVVGEGSRWKQLANAEYVTLEFRELAYAQQFAALNRIGD